jgi:hypothetical protein
MVQGVARLDQNPDSRLAAAGLAVHHDGDIEARQCGVDELRDATHAHDIHLHGSGHHVRACGLLRYIITPSWALGNGARPDQRLTATTSRYSILAADVDMPDQPQVPGTRGS